MGVGLSVGEGVVTVGVTVGPAAAVGERVLAAPAIWADCVAICAQYWASCFALSVASVIGATSMILFACGLNRIAFLLFL